MLIRAFRTGDEDAVVALWQACELTRPWNEPRKDIARKMTVQPDLFLVGLVDERIVATLMAGYEGHRGWVNYLAVAPDRRRRGLARILMQEVEKRLLALGCPKVNIQVRTSNLEALDFYRSIGYLQDETVSFGKRLIHDRPAQE